MRFQFHRKDIEKTGLDTATFLFENTDLHQQIAKFNNYQPKLIQEKISAIDLEKLRADVEEKFSVFGWHGFAKSNFEEAQFSDRYSHYGGLGITYNPYNWQGISNPHLHVLGDKRYHLGNVFVGKRGNMRWDQLILMDKKNEFYRIIEARGLRAGCEFLLKLGLMREDEVVDGDFEPMAQKQRGANTYSDSLAFNKLTPAAETGYLGDLLKTIKRTIVRSRLVELKSTSKAEVHWHTDEDIFICTRINIPVWNQLDQKLWTENSVYPIEVGNYYSWDTGRPHKVEVHGQGSRTNIVLGISPWFDFNHQDDFWFSNEYYGEMHPQEMIKTGQMIQF